MSLLRHSFYFKPKKGLTNQLTLDIRISISFNLTAQHRRWMCLGGNPAKCFFLWHIDCKGSYVMLFLESPTKFLTSTTYYQISQFVTSVTCTSGSSWLDIAHSSRLGYYYFYFPTTTSFKVVLVASSSLLVLATTTECVNGTGNEHTQLLSYHFIST
jgi:hypothetical protein